MSKCKKCGEGEMLTKSGKYGQFMACDQYPECNHTERVVEKAETPGYPEPITAVKKGTRTSAQVDQADYTRMAVKTFDALYKDTNHAPIDVMENAIRLVKQAREEFK